MLRQACAPVWRSPVGYGTLAPPVPPFRISRHAPHRQRIELACISRPAVHGTSIFRYMALAAGLPVLLMTPWLAEQWTRMLNNPLAGLLALALASGVVTLALVWSRYFGLLGASDEPVGSRDWMGYDALRRNVVTGGPATHLYARWLEAFLKRTAAAIASASARKKGHQQTH